MDDGSTDDTGTTVGRFASEHPALAIRYARHMHNRLKAAALNTAIRLARGELLAFVDDDIRPIPCWLEAHVGRHRAEAREVAVVGPYRYPEDWVRASNWVRFGDENYQKTVRYEGRLVRLPPNRYAGGNNSLRRSTVVRVGLFDETSRRSEDVSLGCALLEAGVPLLCEPSAVVYHHAEDIHSIEGTLRSFRRSFEFDGPAMRKKYPWYYERFGHWFLEPPNPHYDTLRRRLAKLLVRVVARRAAQAAAIRLLKTVDHQSWLYARLLHQYVLVCEGAEGVRASRRHGECPVPEETVEHWHEQLPA